MIGPNEQAVRSTIERRPAGLLRKLPRRPSIEGTATGTFASLFNGVRAPWITPNGSFFAGKAEAEWGWPETWEQLRDAGLIDFEIHEPNDAGFRDVTFEITELGWKVRNDDIAYSREISRAIKLDDIDAANALSETKISDIESSFKAGLPLWKVMEETGVEYGPLTVIRDRLRAHNARLTENASETLPSNDAEPAVKTTDDQS